MQGHRILISAYMRSFNRKCNKTSLKYALLNAFDGGCLTHVFGFVENVPKWGTSTASPFFVDHSGEATLKLDAIALG